MLQFLTDQVMENIHDSCGNKNLEHSAHDGHDEGPDLENPPKSTTFKAVTDLLAKAKEEN